MRRSQYALKGCQYATLVGALVMFTITGCGNTQEAKQPAPKFQPQRDSTASKPLAPAVESETSLNGSTDATAQLPPGPEWIGEGESLMDGQSIDGWEEIQFGGEGETTISEGVLAFTAGDPFTGISSTSDQLPKTNYEISLQARKIDGTDFFCGLTFPVADSHCTLIVGGWGGATVGLSCIDDKDASSNETCSYMKFEKEKWYSIRVRVQPETISVWIDDQKIVNQNIEGKKISLRGDTGLCKPMGICSFMTDAQFKNIRIRQFKPMAKPAESEPDSAAANPEAVGKK